MTKYCYINPEGGEFGHRWENDAEGIVSCVYCSTRHPSQVCNCLASIINPDLPAHTVQEHEDQSCGASLTPNNTSFCNKCYECISQRAEFAMRSGEQ